ncbi:MAG: helix-turn-helix domain-containing protein [Tabrizicola sp.]|uniref:helix-turn-helix domain-containing protein n=1 Tax=Tabrizicola sp. TaxID=2005166 RepID=UPI002736DBF4|nr:helix-turn-helix domain-containing protein [Tabrizicola sp.]MDP3261719.1 helix-turn-helix domain-containing protein [Tabrizicola sp.]MDP3648211.1 helix-turn-helix domain-containing protein [Paracoccaceae bacterium]MDZ4069024.1 helix-turn-helix domain-containing protein [Tabrizicola sp.]
MILGSPLLTTRDVAELLQLTETTIRSWIVGGELRAMRFGREYRIAAEDLDAFLEAHATRPVRTAGSSGTDRPREQN